MAGVEILAMEEVVIDTVFNWSAFFIPFGIILGMFLVVGFAISFSTGDWSNIVTGIIVGAVFGTIIGIGFGFSFGIPAEYETQYKVIVSDEVPMSEFFSKYELVEQDGRIYVVTEKD